MMPQREDQSYEDRAKEMQNALNWMRNEGLVKDDGNCDDGFGVSSELRSGATPRSARAADMEKALNWLRNKDEVSDDTF